VKSFVAPSVIAALLLLQSLKGEELRAIGIGIPYGSSPSGSIEGIISTIRAAYWLFRGRQLLRRNNLPCPFLFFCAEIAFQRTARRAMRNPLRRNHLDCRFRLYVRLPNGKLEDVRAALVYDEYLLRFPALLPDCFSARYR
jgi:hypothetical protein